VRKKIKNLSDPQLNFVYPIC